MNQRKANGFCTGSGSVYHIYISKKVQFYSSQTNRMTEYASWDQEPERSISLFHELGGHGYNLLSNKNLGNSDTENFENRCRILWNGNRMVSERKSPVHRVK